MRQINGMGISALALITVYALSAHASSKQTDKEFRTVCGVSTSEETSRDSCLVVDYFKDGQKTQTDLNFPDFGMVLTWQPDHKVNVQSEGEDWGTPEYVTSEGEIRFTIGRVTYYFMTDPEATQREAGG